MGYFPELYTRSENKTKVKLGFCSHTTMSYSKNVTGSDTSDFDKIADLASLKSHFDRLETRPVDLSRISNVAENKFGI